MEALARSDTWASDSSSPRQARQAPLFLNMEDMKQKVRASVTKKQSNVNDLYKKRGFCQRIAKSRRFENLTLCIIAFNAVWLAIDTDFNPANMLVEAHWAFQVVENLLCTYYACEWLIRFMAFSSKRDSLKDGWFVFDSLLLFMMILETWVMYLLTLVTGVGPGGGMGNASMLRLVRLLRLSRMARLARLLRAMPELMILVKGMVAAMRSVFFTIALLFLVMYFFSIALTQLTADLPVGKELFGTVWASMYTLLISGTLLDNIGRTVDQISVDSFLVAVIFVAFVLMGALTIMNMLIGVLCEVVTAVATMEREEMAVNFVNHKLGGIMEALDENDDKLMSKDEFRRILDNPEAIKALLEVDVDPLVLVELADFIFIEVGNDEDACDLHEKKMSFSNFIDVVFSLRGSNQATVKDLMHLHKIIRNSHLQTRLMFESRFERVEEILQGYEPMPCSKSIMRRQQSRNQLGLCRGSSIDALGAKQGFRKSRSLESQDESNRISPDPTEGSTRWRPSCSTDSMNDGSRECEDFSKNWPRASSNQRSLDVPGTPACSDVSSDAAVASPPFATGPAKMHAWGFDDRMQGSRVENAGVAERALLSAERIAADCATITEEADVRFSCPKSGENPGRASDSGAAVPQAATPHSFVAASALAEEFAALITTLAREEDAGVAYDSSKAYSLEAPLILTDVLPGTPAMPVAHARVAKEMRRRAATVGDEARPPRDHGGCLREGDDQAWRTQDEAAPRGRACRTLSLRRDLGFGS